MPISLSRAEFESRIRSGAHSPYGELTMTLNRLIVISMLLATLAAQPVSDRANNNPFSATETSWSGWMLISGTRAAGVDYRRKDDKNYSCVRFRNRYSYPIHIDCIVTVKKGQQSHTERVGWQLGRGESGQDLANDCFQADAILSIKVTRLTKG